MSEAEHDGHGFVDEEEQDDQGVAHGRAHRRGEWRRDEQGEEAQEGELLPAGEETDRSPDVLLDVPHLEVDEIGLEVEDLRARVSLQAEVLDLLKLNVGADVHLGRVKLEIKGVEAQALLKVRLDNVARVVGRVLRTIDNNPQILEQITQGAGAAVRDVGGGAGSAVDELGRGTAEAAEDVGRSAGGAVREAGRTAGESARALGKGAGEAAGKAVRGAEKSARRPSGSAESAAEDTADAAEPTARRPKHEAERGQTRKRTSEPP
ncbi:hypothetical protein PS467_39145 [Streptomyces luomodiensis]|uniref:Uncharacterized protein n=1 Tax=Streptomyces luomodiensis TaxID=3026192 RepID=A0ABY9V805_9ACTN|nr:hypothetical protein [Streptomyces sp. SCA4-21]WNF00929.1 hypothetical protein PS467_39145 [Streptomyces sp. SCA4-21]